MATTASCCRESVSCTATWALPIAASYNANVAAVGCVAHPMACRKAAEVTCVARVKYAAEV